MGKKFSKINLNNYLVTFRNEMLTQDLSLYIEYKPLIRTFNMKNVLSGDRTQMVPLS